ncbi:MAG: aldo/keto reductase [Gammaproteobacteria bacterium]|jgi:diketogulonate reductase-like aldo/keto reductase
MNNFTRRSFLQSVSGMAMAPFFSFPVSLSAATPSASSILTKKIPVSGESIPVIGMGSWITFDVDDDETDRARCIKVLEAFFNHGGGMVDSSPMYGSSEEVIGYCLNKLPQQNSLFSATKVWIIGKSLGIMQMNNSYSYWGLPEFDLMQIHNMLNWRTHLETLKEWKQQGRIRYIGITTSHGRRHKKLEKALLEEEFDFVQFTYNMVDREVEQRLLPVAKERGLAVIINRPFQRGGLFDLVKNKPLPDFAAEIDCQNWAQFFLKFIVSHPAVTCAIPATSQVAHMQENMGAGYGQLPDEAMRIRMLQYFEKII